VAKGAEVREAETAASHDEITRMLAEHGSWNCWIIDFVYFTTDIVSEYKFNLFLLCFLAFWFLTINHAAMRTAIPALCILCLC
jgi:hypothetical protein